VGEESAKMQHFEPKTIAAREWHLAHGVLTPLGCSTDGVRQASKVKEATAYLWLRGFGFWSKN
jgi:hypothetical protein